MKLHYIAAAMALATGLGTAHAGLASGAEAGTTGNGSLIMIAYDKRGGTTTSGVFDLGIRINDLVGAAGHGGNIVAGTLENSKMVWDFKANTFSIDGAVSTAYGNNDWTAAWNRLVDNVDLADLQFVVTAFDAVGSNRNRRTVVTGVETPSVAKLTTEQAANLGALTGTNSIFIPQNTRGTHPTADNGAYTFIAADGAATRANGYAMAGDAFANNWRNWNPLNGETFAGNDTYLYLVDGSGQYRQLGMQSRVSLNVASGQLTVTPVPEPSTYALVVAGLAVAGIAARRRKA
jgi:hypothetical protein